MNEDQVNFEINFDDEPKADTQDVAQGQSTPEAQTQTFQQPAPPAGAAPQALGPATLRAQSELAETQQRYEAIRQRRKQLIEAGVPIPPELEEETIRLAARLETSQLTLQNAQRTDAMSRLGTVLRQLLSEFPPNVAKTMEPHLRQALEMVAYNNPQLLWDQAALNNLTNMVFGQVQRELERRRKAGSDPAISTNSPPPNPAKSQPQGVPDEVKRIGVRENSWAKVADKDPREYLDLDW